MLASSRIGVHGKTWSARLCFPHHLRSCDPTDLRHARCKSENAEASDSSPGCDVGFDYYVKWLILATVFTLSVVANWTPLLVC